MKFISANLKDLRELYNNSLQKSLDMEQQIVKALPTMVAKATDPQLKKAFETHLKESEQHVTKVEKLLQEATGKTSTETCKVLKALVSEADDIIVDTKDDSVRDAALIGAAQQVEHHEIAVYGTLRTWAGLLGMDAHATTLEAILEEEKHADILLTGISSRVNIEAEFHAA